MSEALKKIIEQEAKEVKFETTLNCIKSLMASMKLNFEDTASKLSVFKEDLPKYKDYLFS